MWKNHQQKHIFQVKLKTFLKSFSLFYINIYDLDKNNTNSTNTYEISWNKIKDLNS